VGKRKFLLPDAGGLDADRLVRAIAIGAPPERRLVIGARGQGVAIAPSDFATMDPTALRTDFDAVVGDFSLPDAKRKLGSDFSMARVVVPVRDPLQRALAIYGESSREAGGRQPDSAPSLNFRGVLERGLEPNAQCQRIAGEPSFERAIAALASNTLYFDPISLERFCAGYAHFTRTAVRPNALRGGTGYREILASVDARSMGQFMRRNREDFLLSIWARRTWEQNLVAYFSAAPAAVATA
jgi:hypothetical protein